MQGKHPGLLTIRTPDGNIRIAVEVIIHADEVTLVSADGGPLSIKPVSVKLSGYDKAVSDRDALKLIAGLSGPGAQIAKEWLQEYSGNGNQGG